METSVDKMIKHSGHGAYRVYLQRAHADVQSQDRSLTITMPGLERSRFELTYPARDSIDANLPICRQIFYENTR